MSLIGALAGSGIIGEFGKIIDSVHTSAEEKADAQRKLLDLMQRPDLAQIAVNQEEAKHASIFVAGWRPFIGWVCGVSLAFNFMFYHFFVWGMGIWRPDLPPLPNPDTSELMTLVLSLLGLGAMRSFEKTKGVSK